MVNRRSRVPAVSATITTAPAARGRVISATIVAASRESRPQARGLKPACGRSQIAAGAGGGRRLRQRGEKGEEKREKEEAGYSRGGAGLMGARHETAPL